MTTRIIYEGPVSLAVPTATLLADAEDVELTSSQTGDLTEGGGGSVRLTLVLEGPPGAIAAAVAATRDGLPPEATLTIA